MTLVRIYSVAGHGKGEVDHVGGLAKVVIRREVAAGQQLSNAEGMINCLEGKFGESESPIYVFKEIKTEDLQRGRNASLHTDYKGIKGSSFFQVIIFKPNTTTIRAAPRICICSTCKEDYGSCNLFQDYQLTLHIR